MAGIYVHIPFCASRCIYCGFYSSTGQLGLQDEYVEALLKELDIRKDYLGNTPVETIYIGGGTPSLLSAENIRRLGDRLGGMGEIKEFTMECNPDDITPALCDTMVSAGVNRVSMGVQTFSDVRLKFLHRRHTPGHIAPAISLLRKAGISNISIDLMFGFPNESITEWSQDIDKAIDLDVPHISAYSLMYEEGTPLFNMLQKGTIAENGEEQCAAMYDLLIDKLSKASYEHYEISNFAKAGFHSLHNSNYWNGTKYIGLGAAAHSYDKKTRQWNVSDIKKYISSIMSGKVPMETEDIDARTRYNDMITTALRTRKGINLADLSAQEHTYILRNARKSIGNGLLKITDNRLKLTRQGLFVSDEVMSDLIWID